VTAIAPGEGGLTDEPMTNDPTTWPMTVDVPFAAAVLHISPWCAYELIKKDEFPAPVVRCGRKIRIPSQGLRVLLGVD
jgi:hypothetical protein